MGQVESTIARQLRGDRPLSLLVDFDELWLATRLFSPVIASVSARSNNVFTSLGAVGVGSSDFLHPLSRTAPQRREPLHGCVVPLWRVTNCPPRPSNTRGFPSNEK